jgi:hypothetical protein
VSNEKNCRNCGKTARCTITLDKCKLKLWEKDIVQEYIVKHNIYYEKLWD